VPDRGRHQQLPDGRAEREVEGHRPGRQRGDDLRRADDDLYGEERGGGAGQGEQGRP
jgi:hypothetical protein